MARFGEPVGAPRKRRIGARARVFDPDMGGECPKRAGATLPFREFIPPPLECPKRAWDDGA